MKKLNRKGFTLIELLAVIVILAIIVVVTVPTILGSINDARVSTLHSLSKEVANWFDNGRAQDLMAIGDDRILYGADANVTTSWKCIKDVTATATGHTTDTIATLYNLSGADVKLDGDEPTDALLGDNGKATADLSGYCSAIRYRSNGSVEVLLIATTTGRFATGTTTYALSSASSGYNEYTAS